MQKKKKKIIWREDMIFSKLVLSTPSDLVHSKTQTY